MNGSLEPGTALPRVVDAKALADSIKHKKVHILSQNAGVVIVPDSIYELARQNGMSPAAFMRYVYSNDAAVVQFAREESLATGASVAQVQAQLWQNVVAEHTALVTQYVEASAHTPEQVQAILRNVDQLQDVANQISRDLAEAEVTIKTLTAQLGDEQAKTKKLQEHIDALGVEKTRLEKQLAEANDANLTLNAEKVSLEKQLAEANADKIALETQIKDLLATDAQVRIAELTAELNATKTSLAIASFYLKLANERLAQQADVKGIHRDIHYDVINTNPSLGAISDAKIDSTLGARVFERDNMKRSLYNYYVEQNLGTKEDALREGYRHGYIDGYRDGFRDGFNAKK